MNFPRESKPVVIDLQFLPYKTADAARLGSGSTRKTSATLISFTTAETDPGSFAQKFSMHLRLKEPISLLPEARTP